MKSSLLNRLRPRAAVLTVLCAVAVLFFSLLPAGATAAFDDNDNREAELIGLITSLPNTQGFIGDWTVVRVKVAVTVNTKLDQARGRIAIGALVKVKGRKQDDGSIVAALIEVLMAPPSGQPVNFRGRIEELPSTPSRIGVWNIAGRKVHVTAATKIDREHGEIAVGAFVAVEGLAQNDGSVNALSIEVLPPPATNLPIKFTGKIEKLPDNNTRVGDWVVSGRTVRVTANTRINQEQGQVMIGATVEVEGTLGSDSIVLATRITVKANVDPPLVNVEFRGVIEALPNTSTLIGDWKISGRLVHVTADTSLSREQGPFVVGARVEVSGVLQADGSVRARKIATLADPNPPNFIRFLGKIISLPTPTSTNPTFIGAWKVGEYVVHVSADTKLDQEQGRVQVGALVEVEGKLRDDKSVDAIKITVKHQFNDTANYIRFFATISALPANDTLIGDWKFGDRTVHVSQRTRIIREHGTPRVGAFVEVEGNLRTDGTIDAYEIEVERDAAAPDGAIGFIDFYGAIRALPPNDTLIGDWTVGGKTVHVAPGVKLVPHRGVMVLHAFVEVKGYWLADGSVTAISIELRRPPTTDNTMVNRSFVEFIGPVRSLPDAPNYVGDWVVAGRTVHVRARTTIRRERAQVVVGATVEVYGAELPDGSVDARFIEVGHGPATGGFVAFAPLVSVNAGSYADSNAAAGIIAAFGSNLAGSAATATSLPLPTELAGVSVLIDGQPAGLFFVSPTQINYQVPDDVLPGAAQVTVMREGNVVAQGALQLGVVAPSLFTVDASGAGTPAGLLLRVRATGEQSYEPLARYDAGQSRFVPVTITRQPGDRLFLVFYGTGLRGTTDVDDNAGNGVGENVQVEIGAANAPVIFAGAAPGFAGLDQINTEIPGGVTGANLSVLIKVNDGEGKVLRANGVAISIR